MNVPMHGHRGQRSSSWLLVQTQCNDSEEPEGLASHIAVSMTPVHSGTRAQPL